jgi:hypothetical protein
MSDAKTGAEAAATDGLPAFLEVVQGSVPLRLRKGDRLAVEGQPTHTGNGVYAVRFRHGGVLRTLYGRLWRRSEFNLNSGDPTKLVRVRRATK